MLVKKPIYIWQMSNECLSYTGFPPKMDYHFPWVFQVFQTIKYNFPEYIYTRIYALTLHFKYDLSFIKFFLFKKIKYHFKFFIRSSSFALWTINNLLEVVVIIEIARNSLSFPDFWNFYLNSLSFPWVLFSTLNSLCFPGFPGSPGWWEPCSRIENCFPGLSRIFQD